MALHPAPPAPKLRGRVLCQRPLAAYTSLGIGGPAAYLVEPADLADLEATLAFARARGLDWVVLGNGTNTLFPDAGFPGVVIHLGPRGGLSGLAVRGDVLEVGAGASLAAAQRRGRGALDFLVGIPGTVGGAVAMNAGIPEAAIGDRVSALSVLDGRGRLRELDRAACEFGYRSSRVRRARWIVLSARLRLEPGWRWDRTALLRRRKGQPSGRSPGCAFKNPPGLPHGAGWLIDRCGLKGLRVGKAQISRSHANFILNRGGARGADFLALIDIVRQKVYKEFKVELDLELEVI